MAHVLIVEDEPDLAELIAHTLREAGFSTTAVHEGEAALKEARERPPDLVLLDRMLPDLDGAEVCRQLKARSHTRHLPVVMLTARADENDRVMGFELGADDYITKPFSVRELVLRIRAVLRRASVDLSSTAPLVVGALELELASHRCLVAGVETALTALEFRLLEYLMRRAGRVQTRASLLEEVWGITSEIETRTVDTHMMRLREKLGPARVQLETVRGVGYRLNEATSPG